MVDFTPRISLQGLKVLKAFLDAWEQDASMEMSGADVMRAARLTSGTIYPLLIRLEEAGILACRWEKQKPADLGRPRRRLYSLTSTGAEFARRKLADVTPLPAPLRTCVG
jgi:PadR family transcriptional regulator PadR